MVQRQLPILITWAAGALTVLEIVQSEADYPKILAFPKLTISWVSSPGRSVFWPGASPCEAGVLKFFELEVHIPVSFSTKSCLVTLWHHLSSAASADLEDAFGEICFWRMTVFSGIACLTVSWVREQYDLGQSWPVNVFLWHGLSIEVIYHRYCNSYVWSDIFTPFFVARSTVLLAFTFRHVRSEDNIYIYIETITRHAQRMYQFTKRRITVGPPKWSTYTVLFEKMTSKALSKKLNVISLHAIWILDA